MVSIGCGWHPGRHLFPAPQFRLLAVDADPEKVAGVIATGRADEGRVGYAGKLDDLPDGSFDVVLYRLVLHHLVFQGPLAPIFVGGRAAARPGGALVAIEPGLWHPIGLGLALANRAGVGERGARHAATTSRCRRGGWSPRPARSACVPELHAVTYTWRRLPPGVQRSLQPLDALGSRPACRDVRAHADADRAATGMTRRFRLDRAVRGADTLARRVVNRPGAQGRRVSPGRRERLQPLRRPGMTTDAAARIRPRRAASCWSHS